MADPSVSVVISTFQRPLACERALRSVLEQTRPPLEILICDDGSADETGERLRDWAAREELVRYLRLAENTGTPASPRNLGIASARGDWVAFLDDDDEWLPEKLARQVEALAGGGFDVLASNALRSSAGLYFPTLSERRLPTRAEILRSNPLITSSVLARRDILAFPTTRWLRGIEDYAAWLELADRGARFLVLPEPLVRYTDDATDRFSSADMRTELRLARLRLLRGLRRGPHPGELARAARHLAGAGLLGAGSLGRSRTGSSA